MQGRVVSVHIGLIRPLGPDNVASGFIKTAVSGDHRVGPAGFEGDEQADLVHHGGRDKAVYAYALDQYPLWSEEYPRHRALLVPGGMGENLPITGMNEGSVCLGDLFQIGTAVCEVSQPRQPCFKLGLRFDDARLPKLMVKNCRSGWYLRVVKGGTVSAGSDVSLVERPLPHWPILRLNRLAADRIVSPEELDELARLQVLGNGWRSSVPGLREATAALDRQRAPVG